jgi:2,4-dienoyl-CoA reductase-like NADH-dependent reductase (Old Yellow Enzyme family)
MGIHGELSVLLDPIIFGAMTLPNRVVMAPLATNFAEPDGRVSSRQCSYYRERAKGGVGTVVVEAASVREDATISPAQIGIFNDKFIPSLELLARAIRDEGSVALIQICHGGPKAQGPKAVPVSVSGIGVVRDKAPKELSSEELRTIGGDFVEAARRARDAGFQGIELHAAHFYLLSASLSPFTNTRTDEYGGSLENRTRLTRQIVEETKDRLGEGFHVWVRINGFEAFEGGLDLRETRQIAALLERAGADAIHVSAYAASVSKETASVSLIPVGSIPGRDAEPGIFLDYASAIKEAVQVPVVAVGRLHDPKVASGALREGKCDLVALGRQLFSDPHWVSKVREGRVDEIVLCLCCMNCHMAFMRGEQVSCVQNLNLFGEPLYKKRDG